jgi:CheY-like chemotaxis protein
MLQSYQHAFALPTPSRSSVMNANLAPLPCLVVVDDDVRQLENLALVFKMSGFSVLTFGCPVAALSALATRPGPRLDFAVVDYQMPLMNGSVLAQYLRARYLKLKIVLYSGSPEVPEEDLHHVDGFVRKGTGVVHLLKEIAHLRDS